MVSVYPVLAVIRDELDNIYHNFYKNSLQSVAIQPNNHVVELDAEFFVYQNVHQNVLHGHLELALSSGINLVSLVGAHNRR